MNNNFDNLINISHTDLLEVQAKLIEEKENINNKIKLIDNILRIKGFKSASTAGTLKDKIKFILNQTPHINYSPKDVYFQISDDEYDINRVRISLYRMWQAKEIKRTPTKLYYI